MLLLKAFNGKTYAWSIKGHETPANAVTSLLMAHRLCGGGPCQSCKCTVGEFVEVGPHETVANLVIEEGVPHKSKIPSYTDVDPLASRVQSGTVRLINGSWIMNHNKKSGVLARCQDLSEQAQFQFPSMAPLVSISYCWKTEKHPDPKGELLRSYLMPMFAKLLASPYCYDTQEAGCFLDWCSLPQQPRTLEEQMRFELALEDIDLWYAHEAITVWSITKPPEALKPEDFFENGCGYYDRGWPLFENASRALSRDSKENILLDLGLASREAINSQPYYVIEQKCKKSLMPPMSPLAFARVLGTKSVTQESDRFTLAKTYARAFMNIVGSADTLHFSGLHWKDAEVKVLSESLRTCSVLTDLNLSSNDITDVKMLSDAIQSNNLLSRLFLYGNHISDISPIGQTLMNHTALRMLHLGDNQISDVHTLGEALGKNEGLRVLSMSGNKIIDVTSIGRALEKNRMLKTLHLNNNRISDVSPIGNALAKNSTLLELSIRENLISDIAALNAALKQNSSLQTLQISDNKITTEHKDVLTQVWASKSLQRSMFSLLV